MRRATVIFMLAGAMTCAKPPPPVGPLPALSYACFVKQVEPELLKSCAFAHCHGAAERPMQLFSLAGTRGPNGPEDIYLSDAEHLANFKRVIVYAAPTSSVLPDLLRKPLQLEAGGAGHGGVDRFGRNVYASKDDTAWKTIQQWVDGTSVGCEAPDAGAPDAGSGDAGTADGGGPTCATVSSAPNDWETIKTFVNAMTCADDVSCHRPENRLDAGCFLPDSCETVRSSGCIVRSVRPCHPLGPVASVLWRYSGGFKNHNNKFPPGAADIIGAWIDAGASCDGGGPWP